MSYRPRHLQPSYLGLIPLLCLLHPLALKAGDLAPTNVIRTAADIRGLTAAQADLHYPVRLRGVVTFYDKVTPGEVIHFIQDDTAGIYYYVDGSTNNPPLHAGQLVEMEGVTDAGLFAPVVTSHRIRVLGETNLPEAKPVTYEELVSGDEDSQFVEIHGIVCAVNFDPETKYYSIEIATGLGHFTALTAQLPVDDKNSLVDSTVRVRGVCASHFTTRRQLFEVLLLLPRPADLAIESPAPKNPFAAPPRPISQLLQFAPHSSRGHRVKVVGTVIYWRDGTLYIQDEGAGLYVQTTQAGSLEPGDRVEVLGFPARGDYSPILTDAIFRKIASGSIPTATPITVDGALSGTNDCRRVRIEATVVDRARNRPEEYLVLQADGYIFNAYLERRIHGVDFAYLENGTKVAVTGVCRIEAGGKWSAGPEWRAKSFNLLLHSSVDIKILAKPSPQN